jgi:hypothetical protein
MIWAGRTILKDGEMAAGPASREVSATERTA